MFSPHASGLGSLIFSDITNGRSFADGMIENQLYEFLYWTKRQMKETYVINTMWLILRCIYYQKNVYLVRLILRSQLCKLLRIWIVKAFVLFLFAVVFNLSIALLSTFFFGLIFESSDLSRRPRTYTCNDSRR